MKDVDTEVQPQSLDTTMTIEAETKPFGIPFAEPRHANMINVPEQSSSEWEGRFN